MRKVLLDTTAYVDLQRAKRHLRQSWAANTIRQAAAYNAAEGKPFLSTLSAMEITQGFEPSLRATKLKDFLDRSLPMFEVVEFDVSSACLAGEIYAKLEEQRLRIGVGDTGIAAVAIAHKLTLVSANEKHFARIVDLGYPLNLENWRKA